MSLNIDELIYSYIIRKSDVIDSEAFMCHTIRKYKVRDFEIYDMLKAELRREFFNEISNDIIKILKLNKGG